MSFQQRKDQILSLFKDILEMDTNRQCELLGLDPLKGELPDIVEKADCEAGYWSEFDGNFEDLNTVSRLQVYASLKCLEQFASLRLIDLTYLSDTSDVVSEEVKKVAFLQVWARKQIEFILGGRGCSRDYIDILRSLDD